MARMSRVGRHHGCCGCMLHLSMAIVLSLSPSPASTLKAHSKGKGPHSSARVGPPAAHAKAAGFICPPSAAVGRLGSWLASSSCSSPPSISSAPPLLGMHSVPTLIPRGRRLAGEQIRGAGGVRMMASSSSLFGMDTGDGGRAEAKTQSCDYTTLSALVAEVKWKLPMRVEGVAQTGETSVCLRLSSLSAEGQRGEDTHLLLSWHRRFSRMCLAESPPPGQSSSPFTDRVEPHLQGKYLVDVKIQPFTKIVGLFFKNDPEERQADSAVLEKTEQMKNVGEEELEEEEAELDMLGEEFVLTGEMGGLEESMGDADEDGDDGDDGEEERELEALVKEAMDAPPPPSAAEIGLAEVWLDAAAEKMPRVIVLNSDRKIITAAPAGEKNGMMWKGIGRRYYPAAVEKPIPTLEMTKDDFEQAVLEGYEPQTKLDEVYSSPTLKSNLLNNFAGLSPALVYQIISGAGIPTDEPVDTLTGDDIDRLYKIFRGWLWSLEDSNFSPSWVPGSSRYSVIAWPSPESSEDDHSEWDDEGEGKDGLRDGADLSFESISDMVSMYYTSAELEEVRGGLSTKLEKAISAQQSKIKEFERKLKEAEGAEVLKMKGELLSANQHLIKPGTSSVSVPDWASMGEGDSEPPMVVVDLDPKKKAAENVELTFQKFKKLIRTTEAVAPLMADAQSSLVELVQTLEVLATMPSVDAEKSREALDVLLRMQARLEERGILKGKRAEQQVRTFKKADEVFKAKDGSKKRQTKARGRGKAPEFMRFRSPGGLEVVAGRSSAQNDRVTWGVAKDKDVWFHARGIGGSHVVLICPQTDDTEKWLKGHREDVLFAASIAAFYSKGRKDTKVDVSYTPKRHLRPPPARVRRPGMVMITKEQVVTVVPDDRDAYRE